MKPARGPFGIALREHRQEAGLSQNMLARLAGTDPAYVNRIEDGHHIPTRPVVLSLARALDLTPRQTDRFLHAAGLATTVDWQARAEDYASRLAGILGQFEGLALQDEQERQPFVRRAAG